MANNIALAKKYVPILDEVYKMAAKTSVLDAPAEIVREGALANQILIPSVALDGLGDYNRSSGYVAGDVDFTWEAHTFTQDRGRSFQVDAQDDMETINMAFGATTGQFVRTKVAPEVDAYRFATMAAKAIAAGNNAAADLTNATALQAIDTAKETLANNEVDESSMVLFISPAVRTYLKQSSLITRQYVVNVGQAVINREIEVLDNVPVIVVPQTRFYSVIDINDGTTTGQEAGGYILHGSQYDAWEASTAYALGDIVVEGGRIYKATTAGTSGSSKPTFPASGTVADGAGALVWTFQSNAGKNINFMIVDSNAVLGITKTALPRIFDPNENQYANAWKFDYRLYHDLFVPANKVDGIYVHTKA